MIMEATNGQEVNNMTTTSETRTVYKFKYLYINGQVGGEEARWAYAEQEYPSAEVAEIAARKALERLQGSRFYVGSMQIIERTITIHDKLWSEIK
jgi:hypothetical protein